MKTLNEKTKHSKCNREIKETENTKEKLREVNNRIRRST